MAKEITYEDIYGAGHPSLKLYGEGSDDPEAKGVADEEPEESSILVNLLGMVVEETFELPGSVVAKNKQEVARRLAEDRDAEDFAAAMAGADTSKGIIGDVMSLNPEQYHRLYGVDSEENENIYVHAASFADRVTGLEVSGDVAKSLARLMASLPEAASSTVESFLSAVRVGELSYHVQHGDSTLHAFSRFVREWVDPSSTAIQVPFSWLTKRFGDFKGMEFIQPRAGSIPNSENFGDFVTNKLWWANGFPELAGSVALTFLPAAWATKLKYLQSGNKVLALKLGGRVSAAIGFALETGESFQSMTADLVAKGLSEEDAQIIAGRGAVVYGVISGVIEMGLWRVEAPFSKGSSPLRTFLLNTFRAGAGETTEELLQLAALGITRYLTGMSAGIFLDPEINSASVGLATLGGGTGGTVGGAYFGHKRLKSELAQRAQEEMTRRILDQTAGISEVELTLSMLSSVSPDTGETAYQGVVEDIQGVLDNTEIDVSPDDRAAAETLISDIGGQVAIVENADPNAPTINVGIILPGQAEATPEAIIEGEPDRTRQVVGIDTTEEPAVTPEAAATPEKLPGEREDFFVRKARGDFEGMTHEEAVALSAKEHDQALAEQKRLGKEAPIGTRIVSPERVSSKGMHVDGSYWIKEEDGRWHAYFDGGESKIEGDEGRGQEYPSEGHALPGHLIEYPAGSPEAAALATTATTDADAIIEDEPAVGIDTTEGIVAFHGTRDPDLGVDSLDPESAVETSGAIFFTNNEDIASQFTLEREFGELVFEQPTGKRDEDGLEEFEDVEPGPILEVRLTINNPMIFEGAEAQRILDDTTAQQEAVNRAKELGHDGIIFRDVVEFADPLARGDVFAVFSKDQISAVEPDSPGALPPTPAAAPKAPAAEAAEFSTGTPAKVTAYRGETRGGGGLQSQGVGTYYGLESEGAERFSKKGTVKEQEVSLNNPVVVKNDAELKQIKIEAEEATGEDLGRKGNLYSGWLLPGQDKIFTDYLVSKGHDGIIVDFKEAAGGRQVVVFDRQEAPPTPAPGTPPNIETVEVDRRGLPVDDIYNFRYVAQDAAEGIGPSQKPLIDEMTDSDFLKNVDAGTDIFDFLRSGVAQINENKGIDDHISNFANTTQMAGDEFDGYFNIPWEDIVRAAQENGDWPVVREWFAAALETVDPEHNEIMTENVRGEDGEFDATILGPKVAENYSDYFQDRIDQGERIDWNILDISFGFMLQIGIEAGETYKALEGQVHQNTALEVAQFLDGLINYGFAVDLANRVVAEANAREAAQPPETSTATTIDEQKRVEASELPTGTEVRSSEYTTDPRDFVSDEAFDDENEDVGIWHVTTRRSRVLSEGLKSRQQIADEGGVGQISGISTTELPEGFISTTFDGYQAVVIASRIRIASMAARGEATVSSIIDEFNIYNSESTPQEIGAALGAPTKVLGDWDTFTLWAEEAYGNKLYEMVLKMDKHILNIEDPIAQIEYVGLIGTKEQMAAIDPDEIDILPVAVKKGAEGKHDVDSSELRFKPEDLWVIAERLDRDVSSDQARGLPPEHGRKPAKTEGKLSIAKLAKKITDIIKDRFPELNIGQRGALASVGGSQSERSDSRANFMNEETEPGRGGDKFLLRVYAMMQRKEVTKGHTTVEARELYPGDVVQIGDREVTVKARDDKTVTIELSPDYDASEVVHGITDPAREQFILRYDDIVVMNDAEGVKQATFQTALDITEAAEAKKDAGRTGDEPLPPQTQRENLERAESGQAPPTNREKESQRKFDEQRKPRLNERIKAMMARLGIGPGRSGLDKDVSEAKALKAVSKAAQRAAKRSAVVTAREAKAERLEALAKLRESHRKEKKKIRKEAREDVRRKQRARDFVSRMTEKYIRDYVPKNLQRKFLSAIRSIRTFAQFNSFIATVDTAIAKEEHRLAIVALKKILKRAENTKMVSQFLAPIKELRENFNLSDPSKATLKKLTATAEYLARNPDIFLPPGVRSELERLGKKSVSKLDTDQIIKMVELVEHMLHLNRTFRSLKAARRKRQIQTIINDGHGGGIANELIDPDNPMSFRPEKVSASGRIKRSKRVFLGLKDLLLGRFENVNFSTLMELLGGEGSMTYQHLYKALDVAADLAKGEYMADKAFLDEMVAKHTGFELGSEELAKLSAALSGEYGIANLTKETGETKANTHTITLDNGDIVTFTDSEIISLLASFMDIETLALIEKGTSSRIKRGKKVFKLTLADVQKLQKDFGSKFHGLIAKDLVKYVNESIGKAYGAWSERVYGEDKRRPGTYYFRDRDFAKDIPDVITLDNYREKAMEATNVNQERVNAGKHPIIVGDAFVAFLNHSWTVRSLVNMSEPLQTARAITGSREMKDLFRTAKHGDRFKERLDLTYNTLVKEVIGNVSLKGPMDSRLAPMIANLNTVLALNPVVAFYQPVSLMLASTEIPAKYLFRALFSGNGFRKSVHRRMIAISNYLWYRTDGSTTGILSEGTARGTRILRQPSKGEKAFFMIRLFDTFALNIIWRAAEYQAADIMAGDNATAHKIKDPELRAKVLTYNKNVAETDLVKEIAERTVKNTQPTFDTLHSSALALEGRDKPIKKVFAMFRSQRNKNLSVVLERATLMLKAPNSWERLKHLWAIMLATLFQSIAISMIRAIFDIALGGDTDDPEKMTRDFVKNVADVTAGTMIMGDTLTNALAPFLDSKVQTFQPSPNVLDSVIFRLVSGLKDVGYGLRDDELTKQINGILKVADSVGTLSGIPIAAPLRMAKQLYDNLNEEERRR